MVIIPITFKKQPRKAFNENVKPLYEERDFSQANLLDSFRLLLKQEKSNGAKLESNYYRSVSGKPYDYSNFTK